MLTKEKLEIYIKYKDMEAEGPGLPKDVSDSIRRVFESDSVLIYSLLYDLFLVNGGLASTSFAKEVEEKIQKNCDTEGAIFLRELAFNKKR